MTHNPDPSELLDSLWEEYILRFRSDSPPEARSTSALAVMAVCRHLFEEAQASDDLHSAPKALSHGRAVWSLLAADAAAWLTDEPGFSLEAEEIWASRDQLALISLLELSYVAILPTHRSAVDPVAILVPRWLYTRLLDALQALRKGEVHPIVAPTATGRHDDTWTWDEMRVRALEHVAFLQGQGFTLQTAQERVGTALKVAPRTLQTWRSEYRSVPDLDTRLETAREAGRYKVRAEDDPNYTKGDGNSVDAHVLALFNQLSSEPLQSFGQTYSARFGRRHHTPGGAGD